MKARMIIALIISISMSSWVNTNEKIQAKAKSSQCKTASQPLVKKPAKKGVKLLFESVLYHFI
jgi:hypothetical protein